MCRALLLGLVGVCLATGCAQRAPALATFEAIPTVAPLVQPDVPFACTAATCTSRPEVSQPGALFVTAGTSYEGGVLLEPAFDRGCSVRVIPEDSAKAAARVDEGRLVFEQARNGMDSLWVAHRGAAEEWILVHDVADSLRYRLELGADAEKALLVATGALEIRDAQGHACVRADPPFVVDSAGIRRDARFELNGDELSLRWESQGLVAPVAVDPVWTTTASLSCPRADTEIVMLNDGRVMITGGVDAGGPVLSSYETYDPATGTWTVAANTMTSPRRAHTVTLLHNGEVLAAGGQNGATLATAETWSPVTGTWTATDGGMAVPRYGANQVVLESGNVLVVGGGDVTAVAELYDPATRRFTNTTAPLSLPRSGPAAARLQDGRVLVVGGKFNASGLTPTAEVYDPIAKTFADAGSFTSGARQFAGLTVLPDGQALMYAGLGVNGILPVAYKTAELWNPSTGAWTDAGTMNVTRFSMGASLLPNGQVLVAGGLNAGLAGVPTNTTELYDGGALWLPSASTANMAVGHNGMGMITLRSGRVLIAGGQVNGSNYTATTEIYDPAIPSTATLQQQMNAGREYPAATELDDGGILVAGGFDSTAASTTTDTAQLWTASSGFTSASNTMAEPREYATATLLPTGKVLIAGGVNGSVTSQTSELFDPSTGTFGSPATMIAKRSRHTATLLADGSVLVVGGCDGNNCPLAAEVYNPFSNSWRAVQGPVQPRYTHAAILLRNGKVLVFGGTQPGTQPYYVTTELYDPYNEQFTRVGDMIAGRQLPAVAMLEDGRVLAAGGFNGAVLNTAEIFNPTSNTWSATAGTLINARTSAHAVLLRDGRILIAGGASTGPVGPTEFYDPTRGAFVAGPALAIPRFRSFAVPLLDGKVMFGGGNSGTASLKSVDIFDPGFRTLAEARPLPNFPASISAGSGVLLDGTRLSGVGEGSGGNYQESAPTDHPLVALSRVDNGDTRYLPTTTGAAPSTFLSFTVPTGFAGGHYRAVVIANGVPSIEQLVTVPTLTIGPTKLGYIANVPFTGSGTCAGPFTVELQDAAGSASAAQTATQVFFSTNGTGGFYSTSLCSSAITSATIPALGTTTSFYYKSPSPTFATLTASATGLAPAKIDLAVSTVMDPDHFDVSGFAASVPSGTSAPLTVTARKADGTTLTNYMGTVSFTSSDAAATLPASLTFSGTEHGVLTTPTNATLRTTGVQTISVGDGIATGVHPNITVTAVTQTASKFLVTGFPATVTSGTSNSLTVTAQDASGNTVTNFAGTVTFTSNDPAATLPAPLVFNGTEGGTKSSAPATLVTAGVRTFTATSGTLSGTHANITVNAGSPATIVVDGFAPSVVAGTSSAMNVTINDAAGNTVSNYSGTVTFTSTDPAATLPAPLVFNGTGLATATTSPATLRTVGTRTFTASDGSVSGTHANITVTHASASALAVTGFPATVAAGTSNPLQVTAQDAYGNTVTDFAGTVTFTSTDSTATLPSPLVFSGIENGVASSTPATLRKAGSQQFTATSGTVTGSHAPIQVTAGPATALTMSSYPSPTVAGAVQPFTVSASDAFGNAASSYTGTVTFSSDDPGATLPPPYAFTSTDHGVHGFNAAFITAGTRTLTATDGPLSASQPNIVVQPAATAKLVFQGLPASVNAGAATDFTVEARDAYDNTTPAYTGSVRFLSSDVSAQLPAQTAFTSSDNGDHTFAGLLRFFTAGTQSLTVEDVALTSIRGTEPSIVVTAAGPPVIARDANLKGAVGAPYIYDALRQVTATGTLPIAFDRCGGPQLFSVDPSTGAVQWTPDQPGTFTLCVKATNSLGTDTYSFDVVVVTRTATPVVANLIANPTQGSAPLSVQFDATTSTADASALPLYFLWRFGDSSPSSVASMPVHSYVLAGGYLSKLTATDAYGSSDTATQSILVKDAAGHLPPSAKLVASATRGAEPFKVDFHCDCVPGDAPITAYSWSFGDGQTDGSPAIDHTYGPGNWTATLTVVDANGLTASDSVEIVVTSGGREPPSCSAGVSPSAGAAPLDVTWSGSARSNSAVASQRWEFGASDSVDSAIVQRSYATPARIRAAFVATDADGLTCRREVLLTVTNTNGDVPPMFVGLADPHARCGVPWTYAPKIAGTAPWSWSVSGAPARMNQDSDTGALSWTPGRADVGTVPVTIGVSGSAGSAEQEVDVEVTCVAPPELKVGCGCSELELGPVAMLLVLAFGAMRRRSEARGR